MSGNNNMFLIMGRPASGKTTSLDFLTGADRIEYFNTDMKAIPYKSSFAIEEYVEEPYDMLDFIDQVEEQDSIDTVVVDTLTALFSMFEAQIIAPAKNKIPMWGDYAVFYNNLTNKMKASSKTYIVLAHEAESYNDKKLRIETSVPIKGSVAKVGLEGDYTNIVQATTIEIDEAEKYLSDYLTITDEEREDGVKRVFVTRLIGNNLGHKIRASRDLWKREELYIDANAQYVLDRIKEFYGN